MNGGSEEKVSLSDFDLLIDFLLPAGTYTYGDDRLAVKRFLFQLKMLSKDNHLLQVIEIARQHEERQGKEVRAMMKGGKCKGGMPMDKPKGGGGKKK